MINSRVFLGLLTVVLTLAAICNIWATERVEYRRLMSHSNGYYSSMIGGEGGETIFYYSLENQALLDSLVSDYTDLFGDVNHYVYNCESTTEDVAEGISICTEFWDGQYRVKRRTNIIDAYGRFIHTKLEAWFQNNYTISKEVFRHYNEIGYVDSLWVKQVYENNYQTIYSLKRFFSNNQLDSAILYKWLNQNWVPERRYTFSYSQTPSELDKFIRFDTLESQQDIQNTLDFEQFCNPKVIPASIQSEYWYNGAWHQDIGWGFSQFVQNEQVMLKRYSNNPEDTYSQSSTLKSSFDGNIVSYTYYWSGNEEAGTSSKSFVWSNPVEIDDATIPEVPAFMSLYPNPFSDRLNVSIQEKQGNKQVTIYNLKGQIVCKLDAGKQTDVVWDGRDNNGVSVANGIYFVKLTIGSEIYYSKTLRIR